MTISTTSKLLQDGMQTDNNTHHHYNNSLTNMSIAKPTNPTDSESATDSSTTRSSPLQIHQVRQSDIPTMINIWYKAFDTPSIRSMFPDTPGVRKWWEDDTHYNLQHHPQQKYLKVVDTTSNANANANGRIVAYAKWDLGSMEERGPRTLPFTDEMDQVACNRFFGNMDHERRRLMSGRKHYCTYNHIHASSITG